MTCSGMCFRSQANPACNVPARPLGDTEPGFCTSYWPGFHRTWKKLAPLGIC